MNTERKDLKVGTTYYMDGRRTEKGVFVERDGDSIYFDCGMDSTYGTSKLPGKKHLVPFNIKGDGFEKVLLGDDLTDEDVELLNSFKNN